MLPPLARNKHSMPYSWVVPDLEASIAHWLKASGAGPFFVFEDVHFTDSNYRGKPLDGAAIGQFGQMQIEPVCPLGDHEGIWRDVVAAGKLGFHHAGLYCEGYQADYDAYRAAGAEVAFEGLMMGARTCYLDTVGTLGFMTELITANPVAEMVFGQIRDASEGWDGSEPIRTLG